MTSSTAVEAVAPHATVSKNISSFVQVSPFGFRNHSLEPAPAAAGDFSWHQGHEEPAGESTWDSVPHTGSVCVWKRCIDLFCILLSLPFVLPVMAVVSLWIKLVSRGPAIFRQERIGRNGRCFTLYKFRSMHLNADTSGHVKHFNHLVQSGSPMVKLDQMCDTRLIPLGCLLRAAGLDELPQLFNVLRGDMSLVGPRPCLPEEYRFFSRKHIRFQVLPGLTGIWQSEGKGVSTFSEMNEMDARYVKTVSPLLDLAIMCRTPMALMRQMRLACKSHRATMPIRKTNFDRFGAKLLGAYGAQRMR